METYVLIPNEGVKDIRQFVKEFSEAYFIGGTKAEGIMYSQTSNFAEETVLKSDYNYLSRKDFARILAWKIGKIKHSESESTIVYARDWVGCETNDPHRYGKPFLISSLFERIKMNNDEIQDLICHDKPKESYDLILSNRIKGFGPVYAITLLFFMSKGKYPIYDRFARVALEAIEAGRLPRRGESSRFADFRFEDYIEYKEKMDTLYEMLFPDEDINYLRRRCLDRALWVYGHGYLYDEEGGIA